MATAKVISRRSPQDGREWDCQCARCGSSTHRVECFECNGDGYIESHDDDGNAEHWTPCPDCGGYGGWEQCMSSAEWCEAHPNQGRDNVKRGEIEWYTFDPAPSPAEAKG